MALFFGKVLKIKVTKGELIISNHVETADQYLEEPPPHWLGLKALIFKQMEGVAQGVAKGVPQGIAQGIAQGTEHSGQRHWRKGEINYLVVLVF